MTDDGRPANVADPFLAPAFREARHPAAIAVIGLGYVGLPLAAAFAMRGRRVVGFDIDAARVTELREGRDATGEVTPDALRQALASGLEVTDDPELLRHVAVVLVCVPTPITADHRPDLGPLLSACASLGPRLGPGCVVVFESTVYPGVTEDICGPALAAASGLVIGRDVLLGYSPERINPGDREHRVDTIVKVVSGQTPALTHALAELYGSLNGGLIHATPSIRVAEAAKAIENAQRDINIAFVNEVALLCERVGISVHDVLSAARTKWNFLDFRPGLVGGHCIGVDPYYLSCLAEMVGIAPQIILSGRQLNDRMAQELADVVAFRFREMAPDVARPAALVLGATFKEDVPDQRNAQTGQFVARLHRHGFRVDVSDPYIPDANLPSYEGHPVPVADIQRYNALIIIVAHRIYIEEAENIMSALKPGSIVFDPKAAWRGRKMPPTIRYWSL
ncbi:nucleotide sugar dehydrogenase [Tistrella mobilis]